MTYCVGLLIDTGLVLLSDSRTNAGVDQVNTFRKMATFQRPNDRALVLLSAGNFIESSAETPYFQIGVSKYGKRIIDRVIARSSSLAQAAKCALISMDSTIRSNLSVGPPLDLAIIRRDELKLATHISIDLNNEYFNMIRNRWGFALQEVFSTLPNPNW